MLKRLANLVTGKPMVTPEGREEVLEYYEKSVRISALQTLEADRYNSALLIHMNSFEEPESSKTLINASKRLALSGKECIRRHASLSPVPDLAAADYGAWDLLYMSIQHGLTHSMMCSSPCPRTERQLIHGFEI